MRIAIDFDGTITENAYPEIGKTQPFAFDTLKKLSKTHQLILWTCRTGKLLDDAVEFCRKNGVEFYAINKNYPEEEYDSNSMRKIDADMYIDDRNFDGFPGWGKIYQTITGQAQNQQPTKKRWKLW